MKKKAFWKSKMVWLGVVVAAIPLLVEIQGLIEQVGGPEVVGTVLGTIIIILRFVTKEPVALKETKRNTLRF